MLALGVASFIGAGTVSAHGLWTEHRRGNIEVVYAHGAEDNAYKPQKISRAWAYHRQGKMIPVTVEQLSDHARLYLMILRQMNNMRRLLEYRSMIDRKRLYKQCAEHIQMIELVEQGNNLEAAHLMKRRLNGSFAHKSPILKLRVEEVPIAMVE
ncbi:hypothetical protein CXB40_28340 [Pseudomonas syringae pv. avii]|nr:hypothetical protein CXB40_28340 [Pseudomonas syringae pv. avii]